MVMESKKAIFCWSGGKDSAMALYQVRASKEYKILSLLTTVTEDYRRVSLHGVRVELLQQQAQALDLPIRQVSITKDSSSEDYELRMKEALFEFQKQGVSLAIFGDVFLEDIKKYREENLAKIQMRALFPVWKKDTKELIRQFIKLGFKAIVTCVDGKILDKAFVGREINDEFLNRLPGSVDPCGENGEFHSFVFDGPIFKKRVLFSTGEVVKRGSFYFCDLIPKGA